MVNAAIGLEIRLKSFISVPDQHQGTSGPAVSRQDPTQTKRDAHDLLTLFHAMPGAIRESLALDSQEHSFERYRNVFTSSRYQYESASWKFSDPVLMRLLRSTLASVVGYYKVRGSRDPFVMDYMAEIQTRSAV